MISQEIPQAIEPEPFWIPRQLLCDSLGISTVTLTQWGVRPVAKVGTMNYYIVRDVVENRVNARFRELGSSDEGQPTTIEGAKLREILERTEKLSIDNLMKKREVAPIILLEEALGKVAKQIGRVLESIPIKLKRRCPKLKATDINVIKEEIIKCQNAASAITIKID